MKLIEKVGFGATGLAAAGGAMAQTSGGTIDTSSVLAALAAVVAAAVVIGSAYLTMKAGVKTYKWLAGTL